MIKLEVNTKLTELLEKLIKGYKFPGRICGVPTVTPKLEEADIPKVDTPHAKNMWCYVIPSPNDKQIEIATHNMLRTLNLWKNKKLVGMSGRFHYCQRGFMGWHTNSDQIGLRIYATFCKEDGKSFFRYKKDGKIITEMEKQGWNFRAFEVQKQPNLYWHCVYSDTDRYSFGFTFN